MQAGRPEAELVLPAEEREKLALPARRPKTGQRTALRARIIPRCADGVGNDRVAAELHVCAATICKWRGRFVRDRVGGLGDAPRGGPPRRISGRMVEAVVTKTLESRPTDRTRRSTRSMAKAGGLSQPAIMRIRRAYGLQPRRQETFKLSTDLFFVEKARDIAGLHVAPPEHAMVLCVDEKSQVQALDRSQPRS